MMAMYNLGARKLFMLGFHTGSPSSKYQHRPSCVTLEIEEFLLEKKEMYIYKFRGDEWSIKIFNCSQNFTFARFARKI